MIPVSLDPIERLVVKTVREYIHDHRRIPSEMKRSLKNSPHITTLMVRITTQLKRASDLQLKRRGKRFKTETLKNTIKDITELFIKGFEGHAEKRRESEIQKYMRAHAEDEQKDMQSTLEGNTAGIFEDMGLVIPEDQQDKTENHIKEPVTKLVVDYGQRQ